MRILNKHHKPKFKYTKATWVVMHEAYRAGSALRREMRRRRIRKTRAEEVLRKMYRHRLYALKRNPHERIRTTNDLGYDWMPSIRMVRYKLGTTQILTDQLMQREPVWSGLRKSIQDFTPVARLNPPRNLTTIRSLRIGSTAAGLDWESRDRSLKVTRQKCKFAREAISSYIGQLNDFSKPIGWDQSIADAALTKVWEKINSADIQMNEYVVEWSQFLNLLKDPVRTVIKFHRVLEKWTRRNAWIWVPPRIHKVHAPGLPLANPLGGALMSMRTKKFLCPARVSNDILLQASNRWLQYRYGIAPLASDITKAISMYQSNLRRDEQAVLYHKARVTVSKSSVVTFLTVRGPTLVNTYKMVESKGEFYVAQQYYRETGEVPVSYKLGLHPTQFLDILWNGTPWSFVADWAFNVNSWLTARRDNAWIQPCGNCVTKRVYTKVVATLVNSRVKISASYDPDVVYKTAPLSLIIKDEMHREIDQLKPSGIPASQAWKTLKNSLTGLSLLLGQINRK